MHLSNHIPLQSPLDSQCSSHNGLFIPTAGPLHMLFPLPGKFSPDIFVACPLLVNQLLSHMLPALSKSKTPVSRVKKVLTQIKLMPYSTPFP